MVGRRFQLCLKWKCVAGNPALFPSRVSSAPPERARDFAPTVRSARQGPCRSRPRRSPIGRLASGASASRSGPFRAGASARLLAATSLRSCARLLRNLRGFPPKASLSAAHFSPIARLASAASSSRSGPFRLGASAIGGGIPRGWRWRVRAFLVRPRLPPRLASGLWRPPHPPDAGHPASAEYRLRGLASPRRRG